MKKIVIAVDFDGTLAKNEYPDIGDEVPLAIETCLALQKNGHKIILLTMRDGKPLKDAVNWCKDRGLFFYGINKNPNQSSWSRSKKIYANLYIDDANYGIPILGGSGEKPYVNWIGILDNINIIAESN